MQTLLDYLGNDHTDIYRYDFEYRQQSNVSDTEIEQAKPGELFYFPSIMSFGDYDNSCHVERSNVRVFWEQFKHLPEVKKITGGFGHECIAIDITSTNEEIQETLAALADYPAIDESDLSMMESEMIDESWENCYKSDFVRALEKKFDAYGSDPDEQELRNYFEELCEKANVYGEIESGGNVYFDLDRIMSEVDTAPEFMKFEY